MSTSFHVQALAPDQARLLGDALGDGRVSTVPLPSRLKTTSNGRAIASLGLHMLPTARLDAPLLFEGKPAILVSDGTVHGIMSWEEGEKAGRVEVALVEKAGLAFLEVDTAPDDAAVRRFATRFIGWLAEGWRALPEGPVKGQGAQGMAILLATSGQADRLRQAILDGGEPQNVLGAFLDPERPPPGSRPRPVRN